MPIAWLPQILGAVAIALYIFLVLTGRAYLKWLHLLIDVLFVFMFASMSLWAPATVYLFNAVYMVVPVYSLTAKLSPRLSAIIWQGIPTVATVFVSVVFTMLFPGAMSPLGVMLSYVLPTLAVVINYTACVFLATGKIRMWTPVVRSALWIAYFISVGVYVSVAYELFNVVIYLISMKRIYQLPEREKTPRSARESRSERASSAEQTQRESNAMSFENSEKNASATYTPAAFKGQW